MESRKPDYIPFFFDDVDALDELGDAERGRLLTSLLKYGESGAAEKLGGNERFVYKMFCGRIDRFFESYQRKCQKNSENVGKRYSTNVYDGIPSYTNEYEGLPNLPSKSKSKSKSESKSESLGLTVSGETVRVPQADTRRVITAWNELADCGIAPVAKIADGSTRSGNLSARVRQYGLESVLAAIANIRHSRFLQGGNKNGWVITFDWFLRPNNFPKVLEGQYLDKEPAQQSSGNVFLDMARRMEAEQNDNA